MTVRQMALGGTTVTKLTAEATRYFVWDTILKGFGVRVEPSGVKAFVVRAAARGGSKRISIGRTGVLSVAEARGIAQVALQAVENGTELKWAVADALAEDGKTSTVEDEETTPGGILGPYVKEYIQYLREGKRLKTVDEVERILTKTAAAELHIWPLEKLTAKNVVAWMQEQQMKMRPPTYRLFYSLLQTFFKWLEARELIPDNPLRKMEPPKAARKRKRFLTELELGLVWEASSVLGPVTRPYYRTLMLTAQRREQVATMEWSELNLDEKTWRIPPHKCKNDDDDHVVFLSDTVIRLIKSVPRLSPVYVFSATGSTPVSGYSKMQKAVVERIEVLASALNNAGRKGVKPQHFVMHDFRRSFATHVVDLDPTFSIEAAERAINHVSESFGGIVGTYQHQQFLKARGAMMTAYEGLVLNSAAENVRKPLGHLLDALD